MSEGEKNSFRWPDELPIVDSPYADTRAMEKVKREAAYMPEWPDAKRDASLTDALKEETFRRLSEEAAKIIGEKRPMLGERRTMPMMPATLGPLGGGLAGGSMGVGVAGASHGVSGLSGAGTLIDNLPMEAYPTQAGPIPRREPEPLFPPMKPAIFGMLPNGHRFVVSIETDTVVSPSDIDGIIALLKTQQKLLAVHEKAPD